MSNDKWGHINKVIGREGHFCGDGFIPDIAKVSQGLDCN
jgi:hypothetical protein